MKILLKFAIFIIISIFCLLNIFTQRTNITPFGSFIDLRKNWELFDKTIRKAEKRHSFRVEKAFLELPQELICQKQVEEAILGVVSTIDKPSSPAGEAKSTFHNNLHLPSIIYIESIHIKFKFILINMLFNYYASMIPKLTLF